MTPCFFYRNVDLKTLISLLFTATLFAQSPLINEVLSYNTSTVADSDGDYVDWIELYNPSCQALSLQNYSLSDNAGNPQKWVFPRVSMAPKGFILIFASGKDRRSGELHANFKVKSKGETLFLFSRAGLLIDSVTVAPLAVDQSYGRTPDGGERWSILASPTPRAANSAAMPPPRSDMPLISPHGCFFNGPIQVTLSAPAPFRVVYTDDGSDPNQNSRVCSSPLPISTTTVIKARVLGNDGALGPVIVHTYIINSRSTIPVVSMSTHPDNLFDDDIGIYVTGNSTKLGGYEDNPIGPPANYWEDWERPVHLEFFEPDGRLGFSVRAGVKMFGKTTRKLPQKSFAVFLRDAYGQGELVYPLFPDYPVTRFKSFLLRNGGSDNTVNQGGVQFRDGLGARLLYGLDLDFQAYRPCHLYINGEYWGIYNLREKINEDYLAAHHGVDPDAVDLLDDYHRLYPLVVEGSADHFNALIDYLKSRSLASQAAADYVETQMDVDNYLTYMAVQIFFANHDGPGHNCKFWREQADGRYRWILYDIDHSFGMRLFVPNFHYAPDDGFKDNTIAYYREANGPSWPNPPESTFLFRKILENVGFRYRFINTLADLLNSRFAVPTTLAVYDQVKRTIEPEIALHLQRWGGDPAQWRRNAAVVQNFLALRNEYLMDHIISEFNLEGKASVELRIQPAGSGRALLNSLSVETTPWNGLYFQNVPLRLKAIAAPGFRFVKWLELNDTSPVIAVTPKGDLTLTALFEAAPLAPLMLINEINYNSPSFFDVEDWIELYNPLPQPIDLSGWALVDDTNRPYRFPENTVAPTHAFIVVCRDPERFGALWKPDYPLFGPLPFGLSRNGDLIRLIDAGGTVIDSMRYGNRPPWPLLADGKGATLALRRPDLDRGTPENWFASFNGGTPGRANSIIGRVDEPHPDDFRLSAYPNPFNASTRIAFHLHQRGYVRVTVYNLLGRPVAQLHDGLLDAGRHELPWNGVDEHGRTLSSGIYLLRIECTEGTRIVKVTMMR